ncbi:protein of unknown function [Modestobacter sp. DSM 44400]|uniref:DUF1206 domain-containing protein n=1 Tax=Modestobacter sp. DSM 44400 TaxID=1550230 RepID=UPI00089966EF|nr:DUF1206 domain-containing protein [Modestobacter sp. DSM 44400]SDX75778.1 protein of unknown function [Modestobacter sp. DSM 44400]
MSELTQRAQELVTRARAITDRPALTHLARVGLIAYGLVYLLIGWLAAQLAWSGHSAEIDADQGGALGTIAAAPGGQALLWVLGFGLLCLALWQATEVLRWWTGLLSADHRWRVAYVCTKCLLKGVAYAAVGITTLVFAVGAGYDAGRRFSTLTDDVLEIPGGSWLIGAVAVGVVAVGIYELARGVTGGFLKDIDLDAAPDRYEPVIQRIGQVGYLAKGIAFVVTGGLLVYAAATRDVSTATGLDGAMNAIGAIPTGQWLLTAVAVGFAAFGVYALARARYPDRDPSS